MTKELKAELYLLIATILLGVGLPISSIALRSVPSLAFISLRYLIAAGILGIIFYKNFKKINKRLFKLSLLIGTLMAFSLGLQTVGLLYTSPEISGFIMGLTVVSVPILVAILYKKAPNFKTIIGIILSLIGLVIMCGDFGSGINIGELLTLIGSIITAFQIILLDRFGMEHDAVLLTTIEFFVAGFWSLIPTVATQSFPTTFNLVAILCVLFVAVIGTAIPMVVMNKMQPYTNPTHASIIYLAEPISSAVFSALLGYPIAFNTIIGCVLIILGTLVISIKFSKAKQ